MMYYLDAARALGFALDSAGSIRHRRGIGLTKPPNPADDRSFVVHRVFGALVDVPARAVECARRVLWADAFAVDGGECGANSGSVRASNIHSPSRHVTHSSRCVTLRNLESSKLRMHRWFALAVRERVSVGLPPRSQPGPARTVLEAHRPRSDISRRSRRCADARSTTRGSWRARRRSGWTPSFRRYSFGSCPGRRTCSITRTSRSSASAPTSQDDHGA